jgi:hypothetical protein
MYKGITPYLFLNETCGKHTRCIYVVLHFFGIFKDLEYEFFKRGREIQAAFK